MPHFQNSPLFPDVPQRSDEENEEDYVIPHVEDHIMPHVEDHVMSQVEDHVMSQVEDHAMPHVEHHAMPHVEDQPLDEGGSGDETDEEIWTGTSRSLKKRAKDEKCSEILIQVIKENYKAIMNRKIRRDIIYGKVATEVRKRGVRITRKKTAAWKLVYKKWRKLKESFDTYISPPTGEAAKPQPPLYDELHEVLGNT